MTQIANPRARFGFVIDMREGWLLVSLGELMAAGLSEDDITPDSYRHADGEIIGLEEQRDAPVFIHAWEKHIGRPMEIYDTTDHQRTIRSWHPFGTKAASAGRPELVA